LKGIAPENDSITFKVLLVDFGVSIYKFTNSRDYFDFQSQVRGKDLIGSFDIRKIKAGGATKHHEAIDQNLKIWTDRINMEYSISFYASNAERPRRLEFPIRMLHQELKPSNGLVEVVELNFAVATDIRKYSSRVFNRSPMESSA
jgi:hypothetical protein